MKNQKFSHKTPHLKGKQHQLDPNLDLKQLVHHSTVQYVDRDADGDVDIYDNPKKKTPDENPTGVDVGALSKKLIAKQKVNLNILKEVSPTKRQRVVIILCMTGLLRVALLMAPLVGFSWVVNTQENPVQNNQDKQQNQSAVQVK